MANNHVIGLNGQMPWHLSADLKRFKQITWGYPIIMGRLTFDAIGKPLPGRTNIVVSRNKAYQQSDCVVVDSIKAAIDYACSLADEVFVIGGATLYDATLAAANNLYITQINKAFSGDTFFPEFDQSQWLEVEREDVENDISVGFSYSFLKFNKVGWLKV